MGAAVGGGLAFLAEVSQREVGVACAHAVSIGCTATASPVIVSRPVVVTGALLGALAMLAMGMLLRALMKASR